MKIFNTLKNKTTECTMEEYDLFNRDIVAYLDSKNSKIEELIRNGMLVEDDVNEFEIANEKYLELQNSRTLELTIIVTDDCNFKCGYCYQEDREYKYMNDEVLNSILNYIEKNSSNYSSVKINWFGGEPLLAFSQIEQFMMQCINICEKNHLSLVGAATTNGYLLDYHLMEKLINLKVFLFQITLDGSKEIHNRLRPHKVNNNSFEKIVDNLSGITEFVKKYYRIVLRVNITKDLVKNIDGFIEDLQFIRKNKKIFINCQKMGDYGGDGIKDLYSQVVSDIEYKKVYSTFLKNSVNMTQQPTSNVGSGLCSACLKSSYYIDQDGNVLKCSLAIYDNNFASKNIIGHLELDGTMRIFDDNEDIWIKQSNPDKECISCKFYPLCFNHYCPLRRMQQNKKICYAYKKSIVSSI